MITGTRTQFSAFPLWMQDTFFIRLDSCILAVFWQLSHRVCASYFARLFGLLGLHTCLMGWHAVASGMWRLGFPKGGVDIQSHWCWVSQVLKSVVEVLKRVVVFWVGWHMTVPLNTQTNMRRHKETFPSTQQRTHKGGTEHTTQTHDPNTGLGS